MTRNGTKRSAGRKILIGLVIFLLVAGIGFHLFISHYLPPQVKKRLTEIIVKGSDSLYRVDMGKFDLSFWGGSAHFADLRITIDSTVYKRMSEAKKLPPMTCELTLNKGSFNDIGLIAMIFSKKINIRDIVFDSADVKLARHFKESEDPKDDQPLWKLIQPRIRSISIGKIYCAGLKIHYENVDSAAAFRWDIENSNILISDVLVDSASTADSSRLLFAKNIAFNARNVNLKTTDGLYNLGADEVAYTSAGRSMDVKQFELRPAITNQQLIRHFGYQHEIYKVKVPVVRLRNFMLPQWITKNRLRADTIELASPSIAIHMDRNAKPNPYSKKGKYPQQLLQRAKFLVQVKRLTAMDASVVYTETSNVTNRTGTLNFAGLQGTIDNISNDPVTLQRSPECIARIKGRLMKTGTLNTVLRFNLNDRSGGFGLTATITHLDAAQLQPLFKAMTAVEMQSFNMQRLDYSMTGNENAATGSLSMKYDNMDLLMNQVEPDKSFDKKGLLSFLANRLIIYKENPMNNEERKANGVVIQRDITKSFFSLVWKTMFTASGKIVLRPMGQRKIEKRQQRQERRTVNNKKNSASSGNR